MVRNSVSVVLLWVGMAVAAAAIVLGALMVTGHSGLSVAALLAACAAVVLVTGGVSLRSPA